MKGSCSEGFGFNFDCVQTMCWCTSDGNEVENQYMDHGTSTYLYVHVGLICKRPYFPSHIVQTNGFLAHLSRRLE